MRGRKKKPFKAYRTQENEWIISNSDEKIVARTDAQNWHKLEYIEMGYKHQSDFIVDMVFHEKWGSYEAIEEAGSLMISLGLKKAVWDDELRVTNFKKHREEHFNKVVKVSENNHLSAKEKAYRKHYDEAGRKNVEKFEAEINRYDAIADMLNDLSYYPALKRILKTYKVHLQLLIQFGKNELLKMENLMYKNKDVYTFSVSTRFFADFLEKNDIEMNQSRVTRFFNLASLLGFTTKEFVEAKKHYTKIRNSDIYDISFFSLNDIDLEKTEEVAKVLVDSKFKLSNMSYNYVCNVFSQEIADSIYAKSTITKKAEITIEDDIEIEEIDQDTFFQQQANKVALLIPEMKLEIDHWYDDGGEDVPF